MNVYQLLCTQKKQKTKNIMLGAWEWLRTMLPPLSSRLTIILLGCKFKRGEKRKTGHV